MPVVRVETAHRLYHHRKVGGLLREGQWAWLLIINEEVEVFYKRDKREFWVNINPDITSVLFAEDRITVYTATGGMHVIPIEYKDEISQALVEIDIRQASKLKLVDTGTIELEPVAAPKVRCPFCGELVSVDWYQQPIISGLGVKCPDCEKTIYINLSGQMYPKTAACLVSVPCAHCGVHTEIGTGTIELAAEANCGYLCEHCGETTYIELHRQPPEVPFELGEA